MTSAQLCRQNGWEVGDVLEGDEGYGPTRIRLTALGEEQVLAQEIRWSSQWAHYPESMWDLSGLEWRRVS